MKKKILITGGAGFIGANFVHFLKKQNAGKLVVLDKLTYAGSLENLTSILHDIRFVEGDITDKKLVNELFQKEKFDWIVHFAAETHVDRSLVDPGIFIDTNVKGTQVLLEAARQFGVERYHQVSTDEVYGDLGDGSQALFSERSPLEPTSPYAVSKAAADLLVLSYGKTFGLPVTISRCGNNYGPYQFPEKLIPYFFQLAMQNKPLPLYGDGKNVRDWLYVEDHVEAILCILQNGKVGSVYNIGSHNEKPNMYIAQTILKHLKKPETLITMVKDRLAHDRRYALDVTKIEQELHWKSRYTLEDGLKKTFQWYEQNRSWWEKLIQKHGIDESMSHLQFFR